MRVITREEALETLAMFYNVTPGQLRFVLEEFDEGRGSLILKNIIDHQYKLDKINNTVNYEVKK